MSEHVEEIDDDDEDEESIVESRPPYPPVDGPEAVAHPTEYMVGALPLDNVNASTWAVYVQWRGDDRYAVCLHQNSSGQEVLTNDGRWVWESRPSGRTDEFIAATRFDLETALRLAKEQAPRVRWNGLTAGDILRREAERKA